MKKLMLLLVLSIVGTFAGFSQVALSDVYSNLAGLKGMTAKTQDNIVVNSGATITNLKTASASTSSAVAADNYRNQFIYMIESLPIRNQLISANNQREMAVVFAEPAANGNYNVLILKANQLSGDFSASMGQTNQAGVDAIRNCTVDMDGTGLSMVAPQSANAAAFISMTE